MDDDKSVGTADVFNIAPHLMGKTPIGWMNLIGRLADELVVVVDTKSPQLPPCTQGEIGSPAITLTRKEGSLPPAQ